MTKREFLKELEDRLQMLDEKERKDMIEEYSQHISMCMKSGMKEEEAILEIWMILWLIFLKRIIWIRNMK